jgi:hypothetical protein
MRRSLPVALVVVVGLLLLLDFVVVNPTLAAISEVLLEVVVLLAAAAAVAGGIALALQHWRRLVARADDAIGSLVVLGGLAAVLIAGFYPGSSGASDPAVQWLIAALLAPLAAAIFAMLFIFLLRATGRGLQLRTRQTAVMLAAAAIVVVLLLPLGGSLGSGLASTAGWTLDVLIGGVFRGLLIGVAVLTAVQAARTLLAVDAADE